MQCRIESSFPGTDYYLSNTLDKYRKHKKKQKKQPNKIINAWCNFCLSNLFLLVYLQQVTILPILLKDRLNSLDKRSMSFFFIFTEFLKISLCCVCFFNFNACLTFKTNNKLRECCVYWWWWTNERVPVYACREVYACVEKSKSEKWGEFCYVFFISRCPSLSFFAYSYSMHEILFELDKPATRV